MQTLESQIRYKFSNPLLLAEALTHPSLAYETQGPHFDNQRLEFLGDAVLQLIFTRQLFVEFPELNEGSLTKLRSQLVSRTALARYARRLDLGTHLLMGKGEATSGGRDRASTLSDALEALVGAIYLDSGLIEATTFVLALCEPELRQLDVDPDHLNPKGQLQELIQAVSLGNPIYSIVSQEGPDHCKVFAAKVEWNGQILGQGSGPTKKQAEAAAAREALRHSCFQQLRHKIQTTTPDPPRDRPPGRRPTISQSLPNNPQPAH
jgi:ribonuclease III